MKSEKMAEKIIQARRVAPAQKRPTKLSRGKPTDPMPGRLSGFALIKILRGCFQGTTSLASALEGERRKDERRKTRKFIAMDRDLKAWMLKSR